MNLNWGPCNGQWLHIPAASFTPVRRNLVYPSEWSGIIARQGVVEEEFALRHSKLSSVQQTVARRPSTEGEPGCVVALVDGRPRAQGATSRVTQRLAASEAATGAGQRVTGGGSSVQRRRMVYSDSSLLRCAARKYTLH
jgi:hypothetical protein